MLPLSSHLGGNPRTSAEDQVQLLPPGIMERTERVRIGLDLDGVVVDSIAYWIRVLNREAGTAYLPGDLPNTYSTATLAACSDHMNLRCCCAPARGRGRQQASGAEGARAHHRSRDG